MRDIQLSSNRSLSQILSFDPPKKELLCNHCANDAAKLLEELRGIKADVFPMTLLCVAMRCEKCNLRTGNLYEVRAGEA